MSRRVGHDVDGFLRWIERDLVRFTPLVQLGLTLLGLCHDVSIDDFHEPCLVDGAPGILIEQVPECGSKHALEHHASLRSGQRDTCLGHAQHSVRDPFGSISC